MRSKRVSTPVPLAIALSLLALAPSATAQQKSQFPGPAGWHVEVDPARDLNEAINRLYRERRAPVFVVGEFFDITRTGGPNPSYAERKALDERWALTVAKLISTREFRMARDEELKAKMGMSTADFRAQMIQRQSFANRDVIERHAGRGIHVLLSERPRACPTDQDGYAAIVMSYYPVEGAASDYGSLLVYLTGIGPCASRSASQANLRVLMKDVQNAIVGGPSTW